MNYFSVELCKKLQDKGLVSESHEYWNIYTNLIESQFTRLASNDCCPAFIFQDLLTKDNAVKLWGETVVCPNCGSMWSAPTHCCWYQEAQYMFDTDGKMFIENWNHQLKHLLHLYQQSGLEAVEKYLMENI